MLSGPYTCKQFVQTCLHKLLDDCSRRYKHVAQAFRLLKLRCEFFLTPSGNTLLLNLFIYLFITYFFSTFRYFSLYLFSNLTLCSFFLFLLLYSVLVTHHSAGSDLYFLLYLNSIKKCRSSAVPLEDIAWSIVLQITTAGTTTRCQLRVILKYWCMFVQASTQTAQALAACTKNIKLFWFHASSLRKHANNTLHCQAICANTLFAQIACTCRGRFKI